MGPGYKCIVLEIKKSFFFINNFKPQRRRGAEKLLTVVSLFTNKPINLKITQIGLQ